jgi:hypothetical protein
MRLSWVLVYCLVACGDDGVRHTPDAAPHDGPVTPDAPVDAIAGTPVTISTSVNGAPVPGVHIYFQNADSSVVLATVTDASGVASAVMDAGGYVTAVQPYMQPAFGGVPYDEVDTFVGVKPGDQLHLGVGQSFTSITVTVTANFDPAATTMYVFSPCGTAQLMGAAVSLVPASATFTLDNCGATTDFLLVGVDGNGYPLDTAYAPNVAITDQAQIDLTGLTYAAAPTRTYTYTDSSNNNLQPSNFEDMLLTSQGVMYDLSGTTNQGSASYVVPAFPNAADVVLTNLYPGGSTQETLIDWGPYADTFTADLGTRTMPTFNSQGSIDPATHTYTFSTGSGALMPDFVTVTTSAFRSAASKGWTWNIAAPYATSIVYPTLPTDVFDYNIQQSDNPSSYNLMTGKVPGGYDAVRGRLLSPSFDPRSFVTGATGTAEYQVYRALLQRPGDTMVNHAPSLPRRVLSHRMR